VTLVSAYGLVGIGISTLLHALGVSLATTAFVVDVGAAPVAFSLAALLYGIACCFACHGAYRRKPWGFRLAMILALPALFLIWTYTEVPLGIKIWATILAGNLISDVRAAMRQSPRNGDRELSANV
jgi:hypothetical protein